MKENCATCMHCSNNFCQLFSHPIKVQSICPDYNLPRTYVEAGKKFDTGKLRYDLIPAKCLEQIAKILTFGAEKYGENNWQKLEDAKNRYYAALERHQQAKRQGEQYDKESGLLHSAHVAVNAIFMLYLDLQNEQNKQKENE